MSVVPRAVRGFITSTWRRPSSHDKSLFVNPLSVLIFDQLWEISVWSTGIHSGGLFPLNWTLIGGQTHNQWISSLASKGLNHKQIQENLIVLGPPVRAGLMRGAFSNNNYYRYFTNLLGSIFHQRILTYLSLSKRECSWKNPSACINSCIIVPLNSHPSPTANFCRPPWRPMGE